MANPHYYHHNHTFTHFYTHIRDHRINPAGDIHPPLPHFVLQPSRVMAKEDKACVVVL